MEHLHFITMLKTVSQRTKWAMFQFANGSLTMRVPGSQQMSPQMSRCSLRSPSCGRTCQEYRATSTAGDQAIAASAASGWVKNTEEQ